VKFLLFLYLHHIQYHSLTPERNNPSLQSPTYSWQNPGWSEGSNKGFVPPPLSPYNSGSGGLDQRQQRWIEEEL
jgi:hypothetical protein